MIYKAMTILKIKNPYNAKVCHEETVESTMECSRLLAKKGEPHGSVIVCDFQEQGRGRIRGRQWQTERNEGLMFTVLLRYPKTEDIPAALSLRTGLAAAAAIEDFTPSLKNKVKIKWPNDIIAGSKKIAGILCEADGGIVHIGIGINITQKTFPAPLSEKAGSISLAAGIDIETEKRFTLLEKILSRLYAELETPQGNEQHWKSRIEERLYKKNENVIFIEGQAGSEKKIQGRLISISESGELMIIPEGETSARSFVTGELVLKDSHGAHGGTEHTEGN